MFLSICFQYIFIFLLIFLLSGCDKVKKINKDEKLSLVKESVSIQKLKLPIQVDKFTVWTDIQLIDNRVIYTYVISSEKISNQQRDFMKNYYHSDPKKSEICKSIKKLLYYKISYEYKYVNLKGDQLVVIPFNEEMCST